MSDETNTEEQGVFLDSAETEFVSRVGFHHEIATGNYGPHEFRVVAGLYGTFAVSLTNGSRRSAFLTVRGFLELAREAGLFDAPAHKDKPAEDDES